MDTTVVGRVLEHVDRYKTLLGDRDYYILVDYSGSQAGSHDTPTGQSRWDYQKETLLALAAGLDKLDPDGCTLLLFNNNFTKHVNMKLDDIDTLLNQTVPIGGTLLTPPVKWALDDYVANRVANKTKPNGAMIVIVTDGEPSDPRDRGQLMKTIADFTTKLPEGREEVGILFIQNGKDSAATAFLKEVNDDMVTKHNAKYDIVSVVTEGELEGDVGIIGALVSALTE